MKKKNFKKALAAACAGAICAVSVPLESVATGIVQAVNAVAADEESSDVVEITETYTGYYFSVDDRAFDPSDLLSITLNGEEVTDADAEVWDFITFEYDAPDELYHAVDQPYAEVDMKVYYNGEELGHTVRVYVAVKGDTDLDGMITVQDFYIILFYYTQACAGETGTLYSETDEELETLSYFVSDIDTESKAGIDTEAGTLSIEDAYMTYVYYACTQVGLDPIWTDLCPSLCELEGSYWASETSGNSSSSGVISKNTDSYTITLGTVEVSPEELAENNYQVEIPVTVDADVTQYIAYGGTMDDGLTLTEKTTEMYVGAYAGDSSLFWCGSVGAGSYGVDAGETVDTITVTVTEDAAVGDSYAITGVDTALNGCSATVDGSTDVSFIDGAVVIVENEEDSESGEGSEPSEKEVTNGEIAIDTTNQTIDFGNVEVTLEELEASDYCVEFTLEEEGLESLEFGMALSDGLTCTSFNCITGLTTYNGLISDKMGGLALVYICVDDTAKFTIGFTISSDAAVGDVYTISADGLETILNGEDATFLGGTITIVEDDTTGDLDEDGKISLNDAYLALLAYANDQVGLDSGLTETQELAPDINGDEKITIDDAYLILLYYAQSQVGLAPIWEELFSA